ncbi:MAG TPA: hypothetical protein VFR45_11110 [Nocardioides sp.]|nr:hypothetical protein [Nocardioides sp.]
MTAATPTRSPAPRRDPALLQAMKERRSAERAAALDALLRHRPDLAGVHGPADLAAESVRWSA